MDLLRVEEYAAAAQALLPADVWDYFQGGSGTEATLAANRAAYARWALRPRALTGVSACDLGTDLLGHRLSFPVAVAPTAFQRLAHPLGELATAKAAGDAGTLFIASFFSSQPLGEIAAAASGPLWLQLYWLRRRDVFAEVIDRAVAAGFAALVLTVDAPRIARRYRDLRNGFTVPAQAGAANVDASVMAAAHEHQPGASAIEAHAKEQFDAGITWHDLAWLRQRSPLPLVLKGIVTAEDARLAVEHGVDAVVVSNHGGRQLDGTVASLDALPEVVDAVGGALPVLADGGIRSGTDVFKALALGARAVLAGRPVVWGLAHSGADGVAAVLGLLRDELAEAMVLAGRARPADLDASAVQVVCGCCGGLSSRRGP